MYPTWNYDVPIQPYAHLVTRDQVLRELLKRDAEFKYNNEFNQSQLAQNGAELGRREVYHRNEIQQAKANITRLNEQLQICRKDINDKNGGINGLIQQVSDFRVKMQNDNAKSKSLNKELKSLKVTLKDKTAKIAWLEEKISDLEKRDESIERSVSKTQINEEKIEKCEGQICGYRQREASARKEIQSKGSKIKSLEEKICRETKKHVSAKKSYKSLIKQNNSTIKWLQSRIEVLAKDV